MHSCGMRAPKAHAINEMARGLPRPHRGRIIGIGGIDMLRHAGFAAQPGNISVKHSEHRDSATYKRNAEASCRYFIATNFS